MFNFRIQLRQSEQYILNKRKWEREPFGFLEWILDQHKEKVIDLLMRVTTVSVNTVAIIRSIKDAPH